MEPKPSNPLEEYQTAGAWFRHAEPYVREAMRHSLTVHGDVTTDPVRGALNLAEECGEVAEQALDATRASVPIDAKTKYLTQMCQELDQVAAYAILLRCQMEGEIRKLRGRDAST